MVRLCVTFLVLSAWETKALGLQGHLLLERRGVEEALGQSFLKPLNIDCCSPSAQDDLLYETLTVYETLYYAAMLRLPSTMSVAQKCERVENVIVSLGLDKCRDTIVGAFPFLA